MRRFRFLHTADLHLGSPFMGLQTQLPERWARRVRSAADGVFRRVVEIAIDEHVDFVTIAGDVFDTPSVPMRALFEFARGCEKLREAGIPVFVSHGNHDPLSGPSPVAWPDNVSVFPTPAQTSQSDMTIPSFYLNLGPDTRLQVSGFSYGETAMTRSMADRFCRDPAVDFAIGLYHGAVGSLTLGAHADYCPTSVQELASRGFDVWGLGHIHQPQVLAKAHPLVIYPGVPQGRHVRETGDLGVVIVDVDETGGAKWLWHRAAAVVWKVVDVSLDGETEFGRVPHRVATAVQSALSLPAGPTTAATPWRAAQFERVGSSPAIVRIQLSGVTSLASQLNETPDLQALVDDELTQLGLDAIVERLEVVVRPPVDESALEQSNEFIGEFLRLVRVWTNDHSQAREALAPALASVYHAGNHMAFDKLSDSEIAELIDDAKRLVLTWYAAADESEAGK